ncbi:conserved hypothetical protein [Treponema primitia ZAS-2]|uniref:Plasmid pRiA4b Orf3-like domain-containing protein n=1 Tax=Treponema primitia (strain ATCC BAA-887 / DSM 12427 / ZAS-2) TaxID=545694 RepID=F5YI42_TREPZ|nr:plasmid pRiA4b ORF-3 family protein [Treponema primitia]AEF86444.1 conserved hypothetical protein [Treponema primitia ZAS-2]
MNEKQEDALYDFLENNRDPFTLEEVTGFVRLLAFYKHDHLGEEIASFIDSQNIAFKLGPERWVSRRGCFEPLRFVISPTRSELLNGTLIPGHRCVPFANPMLMPQEYSFFYKGRQIPFTTLEGEPEEFYPYYTIFGEEYAPQYVARDNPSNESAFNSDPYEDPPDVSIQTLDMRNLYRELSFVPGDRFVVKTRDWKEGSFELERVGKDEWSKVDLYAWLEAAEGGFEDSFNFLGPGSSTEEQIAYAYWYGGKRMRDVPAYSMEDFLYEQTDRIETTPYGIETRFWFAGREIPDLKRLEGIMDPPDRSPDPFELNLVEKTLNRNGIPVSEDVVKSYILDALFRRDKDISALLERIVPPSVALGKGDRDSLEEYLVGMVKHIGHYYSPFKDAPIGAIRQRMGELHTAVIDLAARLCKGDLDPSWLPKHTFIILSQIQGHASGVMEDLDTDESPPEDELDAMDNSLDSMIETYEDMKDLIEDALDSYRQSNISEVKFPPAGGAEWRIFQVSLGGTDVWRRLALPESCRLGELHALIQALFGWSSGSGYHYFLEEQDPPPSVEEPTPPYGPRRHVPAKRLASELTLGELNLRGGNALIYEYGGKWTVKILLLSRHEPGPGEQIRCVAGAEAAPPEYIDGPMRFRRYLAALEQGAETERQMALRELGKDFDSEAFDINSCNRSLAAVIGKIEL